jgi:hypothetical protein
MDHKDLDEKEPDLLFVLTDPSTRQKPRAVRLVINRYVQHYSKRKRKQIAAKKLGTKGPIPFRRRATDDDDARIETLTNISGVKSCSAKIADSSALISRHGPPLWTSQANNPSVLLDAAASIAKGCNPKSFFSIAELDPFASSIAPLTSNMNTAFHHCKYW